MSSKTQELSLTIPSELNELNKIEHLSGEIAEKMSLTEDQHDNLSIAVTEAVGNAIVHGNKKDPTKNVYITFKYDKNQVKVSVRDEGEGFKPDEVANPLAPNNLLKESGRGIFILKSLMDEVSFTFSPKGTSIHFVLKKKD